MTRKYTAIVRKSKLEYVAVCLELNVSARGVDLADVEKNLLSYSTIFFSLCFFSHPFGKLVGFF
jgi:hypothetical protein